MNTYFCKNCNKECSFSRSSKANLYCSNKCQGEFTKQMTLERFNRGEVFNRPTIRYILESLFGSRCSICKISDHNNLPITFQVDHIDGNAANNLPNNLRLLCPNCHSQTDTFGARNKGSGRRFRGMKHC